MKDVSQDVDDRVVNPLLSLRNPAAEEQLKAFGRMIGVLPAKVVPEGLVSLNKTFSGAIVLRHDPDHAVVPETCFVSIMMRYYRLLVPTHRQKSKQREKSSGAER